MQLMQVSILTAMLGVAKKSPLLTALGLNLQVYAFDQIMRRRDWTDQERVMLEVYRAVIFTASLFYYSEKVYK